MPITTRTQTKATHRTTLTYIPDFGERKDKGKKFAHDAIDLVQKNDTAGRLIIEFGLGGGVSSVVFEETQAISQRDIQYDPLPQ
jgi:hypothetical protein